MVQMAAILKNDSHFEFQNSTNELFYANYLKLPKADSEPTKIFCKLVLGPLCYKLITIVNCYLEAGLTCFVYCPKALYLIIFIVWHPF